MGQNRPPLEYLIAASQNALEAFELGRLNRASNLRKELRQILEEWVESEVESRIARWLLESRRAASGQPSSQVASVAQFGRCAQLEMPFSPDTGSALSSGDSPGRAKALGSTDLFFPETPEDAVASPKAMLPSSFSRPAVELAPAEVLRSLANPPAIDEQPSPCLPQEADAIRRVLQAAEDMAYIEAPRFRQPGQLGQPGQPGEPGQSGEDSKMEEINSLPLRIEPLHGSVAVDIPGTQARKRNSQNVLRPASSKTLTFRKNAWKRFEDRRARPSPATVCSPLVLDGTSAQ